MRYDFIPKEFEVAKSAKPRNLTGLRFTLLTAIKVVGKHKSGSLLWECLCDCGNVKNVPTSRLVNGTTHSCGCYRSRVARTRTNQVWNTGLKYCTKTDSEVFKSKTGWTQAAFRKYGTTCAVCGWDKARCDVHHVVGKKDGGLNTLKNAVVLCPNCHRLQHEKGYKK